MKQQLPIIDCDRCGACCLHVGHPPFIPHAHDTTHFDPAYLELPPYLLAELAEYRAVSSYGEAGPCVWLDQETMRCKHYAFRPTICREFQVGSDACWDMRWRRRRFDEADNHMARGEKAVLVESKLTGDPIIGWYDVAVPRGDQ